MFISVLLFLSIAICEGGKETYKKNVNLQQRMMIGFPQVHVPRHGCYSVTALCKSQDRTEKNTNPGKMTSLYVIQIGIMLKVSFKRELSMGHGLH